MVQYGGVQEVLSLKASGTVNPGQLARKSRDVRGRKTSSLDSSKYFFPINAMCSANVQAPKAPVRPKRPWPVA